MKKRQPKSVSFNLLDEYEKGLLEYAEKKEHGNFSRYIKRLIANDREGWQARPVVQPDLIRETDEDIDAMKSFL